MTPLSSLEDVYDITPCYFFSFSETGKVTRMNGTMLQGLGYTQHEVVGQKKFTDILTMGSKIFYQTHFFPLIKMHRKFDEIFLSFLTKDGREIPVLLNVKLAGDEKEYEIHCGGMQIAQRNRFEKEIIEAKRLAEKALIDNEYLVSLRKELEENQQTLEKRLQRITQKSSEQKQINTVVAHDLQEPLRKICVFSNLMLSDSKTTADEKTKDYLKKINLASEKMRQLVLSIQKYLTLNEKHYSPRKVELSEVFRDAKDRIFTKDKDFEVEFKITDLPVIHADYHLLVSVFCELLSNSIKFRDPKKKRLEISLTAEIVEQNIYRELEGRYKYEEFFRIHYSDNGIGFDRQYEKEVFILFRKAHDNDSGLGFGLAYCKKIMDLHQGFISAKTQEKKGSEFTLLLPVQHLA